MSKETPSASEVMSKEIPSASDVMNQGIWLENAPAKTCTITLECSDVEGQTLERFGQTQPITTWNPVGDCLYVDIVLGGEKVTCLLDTGSQVSTLPCETV